MKAAHASSAPTRRPLRRRAVGLALGFLLLLISPLPAPAQTPPDPDQFKAWRARFLDGVKLVEQNKFTEALAIFDGILAEAPDAPGSLLMSGVALNHLGRWEEADRRLSRFLVLQPNHVTGTLAAIQAKQGLKQTAQADQLRDQLRNLRRQGKDPRLTSMKSFERERELRPNGVIWIVLETFQPEGTDPIWAMVALDAQGRQTRRLEWAPLPPEAGQKGNVLGEPLYQDGALRHYRIHQLEASLPDYDAARAKLAKVMAEPPAP
ncbi:MAG: tetratricopeptide repeat protein [Verrucomicrobiia bacterium]